MFCKKRVFKNFGKFTWKHLCQSLFFNKVASLRPATLFKMKLWQSCFTVNFAKILRTPSFIEELWLLLLYFYFSVRIEYYCKTRNSDIGVTNARYFLPYLDQLSIIWKNFLCVFIRLTEFTYTWNRNTLFSINILKPHYKVLQRIIISYIT